jgi:hypothetical protein
MRRVKNLKRAISTLRRLAAQRELEPRELEDLERSIKDLEHAVKVGKRDDIEKAINSVARLFLRGLDD